MGKKRVTMMGDILQEEQERQKRELKRQQKALREGEKLTKVQTERVSEAVRTEDAQQQARNEYADMMAELQKSRQQKLEKERAAQQETMKQSSGSRIKHPFKNSRRYLQAKSTIKESDLYSVGEAVQQLKNVAYTKFTGTIELHVNFHKVGLFTSTTLELPHSTGKSRVVAVVNEETLKKISQGQIDFDILFASPAQMKQLVPYAKVLGPRGLMPNPKTGTLVDDPEKAAKGFTGSNINLKPEAKFPLLHTIVGKIDMKEEHLMENLHAVINTIGAKNIKSAFIASTMSPSLEIDLTTVN